MILDGKTVAQSIYDRIASEVKQLSFTPVFCDVLVGDDPVSLSYVKIKGRAAEQVGMRFNLAQFPYDISQDQLIAEIKHIQAIPFLCGLIVQLPLPGHMHKQIILDAIDSEVDVDCLSSKNSDQFYQDSLQYLVPPTAGAIMELLKASHVDLADKNIVVVGKGLLVGQPVYHLLQKQGLHVVAVDKNTPDAESIIKQAEVIISGTGQAGVITGVLVKEGAVVIDAGTAEQEGGIVGDVDMSEVMKKASYITPVPGGVGPVTVAKLLENVLAIAKLKNSVQ